MDEKPYYFEYLKKTDKFPQSLYHQAKHDEVFKAITSLPVGSRVLDAGCGIGQISGRYADRYTIFGIDEQKQAIDYCIECWQGNYVKGSLYNIPYEDNFFDLVLFLDAIEHLDNPVKALVELKRILKPEGKILVCTMNYDSPLWFILEHTWHRFAGGTCKPYSEDVHPTQYTPKLMRDHCSTLFEEISLHTRIMHMEIFFVGRKND